MSFIQNFKDYTPEKSTLVWTAVGASALTMAVGFMWAGWVTESSAEETAAEAAAAARAELAATICAENFRGTSVARAQYEEISELRGFRQRQFVEEQPWALMPGEQDVTRAAAERCAELIVAMDVTSLPPQVTAEVPQN
ncbi:hypothetical protein C2I36_14440 [Rhodobacteraceae bacterium WD3A24]|nr:hypothetical protein C2I36_14440 [Rhodobacteraceae bacterium WD3A24]